MRVSGSSAPYAKSDLVKDGSGFFVYRETPALNPTCVLVIERAGISRHYLIGDLCVDDLERPRVERGRCQRAFLYVPMSGSTTPTSP
jgi:hypothetical protein